jgi:LPXTG-motif cell wall-anchored protein
MVVSIVALLPQPVQVDAESLLLLVLALVAFLVGWLIVSRRRRR